MKCLYPRCKRKATKHHWPVPKAKGGKFTVPICRMHHNLAHEGNQDVIEVLIQRAPSYWADTETWKYCQRQYFDWLAQHDILPADQKNHILTMEAGNGSS